MLVIIYFSMGAFKKSGGFGRKRGGGFRQDGGRPSFGGKQSFGGGRPSFGGRSKFSRNDREGGDREMFRATCATCQKSCEVPFRPTGEKPVYCSNCFGGKRENREPRRAEAYASPRREKPGVFGGNRDAGSFSRGSESVRMEKLENKIDALSIKLDRILRAVCEPQDKEAQEPRKAKKPVDESLVRDAVAQALKGSEKKAPKSKLPKTVKKTVTPGKKKAVKKKSKK